MPIKSTMTTRPNNRALDAANTEARMDAIRLKQLLGGPLTDQELMCLQMEERVRAQRFSTASPTPAAAAAMAPPSARRCFVSES